MEILVGLLDGVRSERECRDASELNAQLRQLVADSKYADALSPRPVTDEQLARVRALRGELLRRWSAVAPGDAIEFQFTRPLSR